VSDADEIRKPLTTVKLTALDTAVEIIGRVYDQAAMDELLRRLRILRDVLPEAKEPKS
jgi:hypothetical protein